MMRTARHNLAIFAVSMLVAGLIACNTDSHPAPNIGPDQYARIMADLSVAEAATLGLSGYPKDSLQQAYFMQVFAKHQITQAQYEAATSYYARDLDQMRDIIHKAQYLTDSIAAPLSSLKRSRQ
ncbi:MAG: DUF4296 domain-containing protein [Saprospiraceae bacterium]